MKRLILLLVAACCSPWLPVAAGATLTDVKMTTDRSVDTSTAETIARDVCTRDMTDEQKAVALLDWFERCVYHCPTPGDVNQNMHKVLNVYGGVVCGTQACQMAALCRAAGFEARVTCDAGGGHTYYEVKYGDAWHGFDTMDRFYVYTRGEPRQVASYAEIDKDPSLVKDAVKENRACPAMCFHGDDPMGFVSSKHRVLDYKPTAVPGLERLSLAPGQSITWYWYNLKQPHPLLPKTGMAHSCTKKVDQKNPVNWAYWEPYYYAASGMDPEQATRRTYANGVFTFEPDLKGQALPEGFDQVAKLAGPGLRPQGAQGGSAVIALHCPFVIVAGTLTLKAADGSDLRGVTVSVATDGKTFTKVKGAAGVEGTIDLSAPLVANWSYDANIKLELADAQAAIRSLKIELVFMHNKFTRPGLLAGANKVRLQAASLEGVGQHPVTVEYAWQEGPAWDQSEVKKDSHVVKDAASAAWEVNVAGKGVPRMKHLTIRAD